MTTSRQTLLVKKRIRELKRATGLQTTFVRSTPMRFLSSRLSSSSSLLLLFFFLFFLLIQTSDAEETDGSLTDLGEPSTTSVPCTEVSIDALWMRLDFHNGRTAELEKNLIDSNSDSLVVSSNHKGSKTGQRRQNKQQSSLKSSNSSSELSPQQIKNTRSPKPRRHSTVRSPRRHHNKNKKSSSGSPTTITTTTKTAAIEQTSTPKRPKQDKRKRSDRRMVKRNSEPIDDQAPWLCHMTSYWQMLEEDTIPRYVKTGNCSTNASCYQGSYDCAPKKYIIKVMKRLKNVCYPVPTTDTTKGLFEEAWVFVDMEVTVACECSNVRQPGIYRTSNNSG